MSYTKSELEAYNLMKGSITSTETLDIKEAANEIIALAERIKIERTQNL